MYSLFKDTLDTSMLKGRFNCKGGSVPEPQKAPAAPPAPAPVAETSSDVQQNVEAEKERQKRLKGYTSTMLTGRAGLGNIQAPVQNNTTLGAG